MKAPSLQIDFASAKPPAKRAARWIALLGGAALIGVALPWAETTRRQAALAQALKQAEQQRSAITTPGPRQPVADPKQIARERALRDATRGLTTPWADLFAALEGAPTDAVALLSIEPNVPNRSVRLGAEARDAKAMLSYLAVLQHDVRLAQVVLITHQVQLQTPGTPVRFQIQALWADER